MFEPLELVHVDKFYINMKSVNVRSKYIKYNFLKDQCHLNVNIP